MMLFRYTSRMPRWPAHSLPGGASGRRSRRLVACSRYVRMSQSRELERGFIGRRERGEIASASGTKDHRWTVMTWGWKPLGGLNARSGTGLSDRAGSLHPNLGANLAADAQRLER